MFLTAAPELDDYGRHLIAEFPTRFFATAEEAMASSSEEISAGSSAWVLSCGAYTWTDEEGQWLHPEYGNRYPLSDFYPDELQDAFGHPLATAPPPVEIAVRHTSDDPDPSVNNFGPWELIDEPFNQVSLNQQLAMPDDEERFRPVFDFPQPDGTTLVLDFTAPGGFGHVSIAVQNHGGGAMQHLDASHTCESQLVIAALAQMARHLTSETLWGEVHDVQAALRDAGAAELGTSESEHDFRRRIDEVEHAATGDAVPVSITCITDDRRELLVSPEPGGLWFDQELLDHEQGSESDNRLRVFVPNERLWMLVTGLIWRTFGEDDFPFSRRSRNNTAAYLAGLDRFVAVVHTRITHQ